MAPRRQPSSSPAPRAPRAPALLARKRQLVEDAIWDAATDLFDERGFDETTVDDIAQAAGVSRRSFFRYFSSKNDLMAHGMVKYGEELAEAIDACPQRYSIAEIFRATVMRVAQQAAERPRTWKSIRIVLKYPAARAAELTRFPEVHDRVGAAFRRRFKKVPKDDPTPQILAGLMVHLLGQTFLSWFEYGQRDIRAVAEQVFTVVGRLMADVTKRS
jgi:AcrR family transcriptional regulator